MALKPTIYKFSVSLSDQDRHVYDSLNLTIAQHPSETLERMITRLLAYCFNVCEGLVFTRGLSSVEEPDIWQKSLDDQLCHWIDIGEPSFERMKKATRLAQNVSVYSFNLKSAVWWQQEAAKFSSMSLNVYQFPWPEIQSLATNCTRTMEISVNICEASAYVTGNSFDIEIPLRTLQTR